MGKPSLTFKPFVEHQGPPSPTTWLFSQEQEWYVALLPLYLNGNMQSLQAFENTTMFNDSNNCSNCSLPILSFIVQTILLNFEPHSFLIKVVSDLLIKPSKILQCKSQVDNNCVEEHLRVRKVICVSMTKNQFLTILSITLSKARFSSLNLLFSILSCSKVWRQIGLSLKIFVKKKFYLVSYTLRVCKELRWIKSCLRM